MKSTSDKDKHSAESLQRALMLNSVVFPGLGYFFIGQKLKGSLVIFATCYFILIPILRFTKTLFSLTVPTKMTEALSPTLLKAVPLAWLANKELILWSLLGIVVLWLISIFEVWKTIRNARKEQST